MTTKHTRENYFYKQIRLAAKAIKGIFETIRTDRKQAKEKARSTLNPAAREIISDEDTKLIQEYTPFNKKRKKAFKKNYKYSDL